MFRPMIDDYLQRYRWCVFEAVLPPRQNAKPPAAGLATSENAAMEFALALLAKHDVLVPCITSRHGRSKTSVYCTGLGSLTSLTLVALN
jgi:hypothetical protein